jgi:hypothetical protein
LLTWQSVRQASTKNAAENQISDLRQAFLLQSARLTNIASKEEQEARDLKNKLTKVEGQASIEIQELRAELDKIRGSPVR